MPLADQAGLMWALTDVVLREALAQCRRWRDDGLELRMSVNLSPRSLSDPELPGRIAAMLAAERLEPEVLQLEITESRALPSGRGATRVADELRAMGVSIAIDDFGTGFSSLVQLQRLPVDEIKIDRSFVATMAHSQSDAAIVRSTIDLARNLGLRVTAEGVETEEARESLRAMGCELAQGYGLCRPVSADRCARVVRGTAIAMGSRHEPRAPRRAALAPRSSPASPPAHRGRRRAVRLHLAPGRRARRRHRRPRRGRSTRSPAPRLKLKLRYGRALDGFAADLTAAQLDAVRADPAVAFVEPDVVVTQAGLSHPVAAGETVPPGIRRVGGVAGTLTRPAAAPVAVLDSGLDLANADLVARAGINCVKTGTAPQDDSGHGTNVGGIIGARNSGAGVTGVAPGTPLYAVKVLGKSGHGHALPDPLRHQLGHGQRRRARASAWRT